ncbi:hypothetical protein HMI56_005809 [Coelomomyces lativittatus]|nr:hypothetical protein HMI56_005809 [Coelomomyces lativittatus]
MESQQETLKQIQHELHEIKSTQNEFKKSVFEPKTNAPVCSPEKTHSHLSCALPPPPPPPPPPLVVSPIFDFKSQIQRLTEERELLLKSGVYRPSDPLIRDITLKIEEFSRGAAC